MSVDQDLQTSIGQDRLDEIQDHQFSVNQDRLMTAILDRQMMENLLEDPEMLVGHGHPIAVDQDREVMIGQDLEIIDLGHVVKIGQDLVIIGLDHVMATNYYAFIFGIRNIPVTKFYLLKRIDIW